MQQRLTKKNLPTLALVLALSGCLDVAAGTSGSQQNVSRVGTPADGSEPSEPSCTDANSCDDGDPCTDDSCVDSACTYTAISECSVYDCNSLGTMDSTVLTGLSDGALWKASGTPVSWGTPSECTQLACEASEPCCNTCDTGLGLDIDGTVLDSLVSDQDVYWACATDECGETRYCEPLVLDSNYWLWGRVNRTDESSSYVVQGWCRQTTTEALPGEYVGTWAGGAEAHTVQLTIDHKGSWSIVIEGIRDCPTCDFAVPNQYASGVAIRDGSLEFEVNVCDDPTSCTAGSLPVKVTLSSHRDRLIGTFAQQLNFGGALSAELYEGAIGLERKSP